MDTHYNLADLPTRGILPRYLIYNSLWWNGPEWLQRDSCRWPSFNKDSLPDTHHEQKPIQSVCFKKFEDILDRFSDLGRAFRVI